MDVRCVLFIQIDTRHQEHMALATPRWSSSCPLQHIFQSVLADRVYVQTTRLRMAWAWRCTITRHVPTAAAKLSMICFPWVSSDFRNRLEHYYVSASILRDTLKLAWLYVFWMHYIFQNLLLSDCRFVEMCAKVVCLVICCRSNMLQTAKEDARGYVLCAWDVCVCARARTRALGWLCSWRLKRRQFM
jgi:hypothetical protein